MAKKTRKERLLRQVQRRVEETETATEALVLRLQRFLERNVRRVLRELEAGNGTAREAAKALAGLESALMDDGLDVHLQGIRKLFDRELAAVQEEFEATTGKEPAVSGFSQKALAVLQDDRLDMAARYVQKYIGDVRSVVLDTVVAGKSVRADAVIAAAEGSTLRSLQTEINTSLMAYQRATHAAQAKKAGITKFLYIGPRDSVTRPFCGEHVDKIYTREEIERLDNGQDLPVVLYGGGYNCRHHWRPVSDELAEELMGENGKE